MDKQFIRTASDNGYSNWEILSMLIENGAEYPDAVHAVVRALGLPNDERQQMELDYDECC